MARAPEQQTIVSIQVLRGVAATVVVFVHVVRSFTVYHYGTPPKLFAASPFSDIGGIGVDVFFVISGFIMSYIGAPYFAGNQPPSDFLVRRLLRIYPMYLVATALTLAFLAWPVLLDGAAKPADFTGSRLLTSLLFIPSFGQGREVEPIVDVGWTLLYEMYFYLVLTLSIYAAKRWATVVAASALAIIWAAASLAHVGGAIGAFLQRPIIAEFIFGLGVGYLYSSGRLPKRGALPLLGIATVALIFDWRIPSETLRPILWGMPSALIVAAILVLEKEDAATRRSRIARLFGDASYSIYLLHMIVIYDVAFPALRWSGLIRAPSDFLIVLLASAALTAGLLAHVWIERPVGRRLRAAYRPLREPAEIDAPSSKARAASRRY